MKEKTYLSQQTFFSEKTFIERLEEKLKKSIFQVLLVLLKNSEVNFWFDMVLLLVELFQFFYYPFFQTFNYIWKNDTTFSAINNFVNYFNIATFFTNNLEMYLVGFYCLIFLVILVILDIIYVSVVFSKNKIGAVWPMRILRSVVSFIVTTLFMPIFEFFVTIIECIDVNNSGETLSYYYNQNFPDLICWQGTHWIHAIFAILTSVVFCSICIVVQLIFYEIDKESDDAKTNSRADLLALLVKIVNVLLYSFPVYYQTYHWIIIIVSFILSLLLFLVYWYEKPFYDEKKMKAYLIYTGIIFWSNTVLLLGKILVSTEFDGCIDLFFIGLPIIVAILFTQKDDKYSLLLTNFTKFEKGELISKQIRYYLELVDKKDKERNSKLLLKGFIYTHVETCTLEDCPLKKYIKEETQNNDPIAFLYEHAQSMYQNGISKFSSCSSLRLSYALFLIERMNNKKQALVELKNVEKYGPTFEEQFMIYRLKETMNESNKEKDEHEMDVVSTIAYKNHFSHFKNGIIKATALYIDFWGVLLGSTQDAEEDLEKMNELGSQINGIVEEITINFDKMQKLKADDAEVFKIYSEFLSEILNDKEKSEYYKNRKNEIQDTRHIYEDNNPNANGDLNNMIENNDETQYIILSAEFQSLGLITKISTGICSLFGYSRDELVGKNVEFIMPEQYHKTHRNILREKVNFYKKTVALNFQKENKAYKPISKEVFVFGKSKSRFLIPMSLKVCLMPSSDISEPFFLAKLNSDESATSNTTTTNNSVYPNKVCYVLTNKNFIVQNFTANAINLLGLQSNAHGNMDITKEVKEFIEDFQKLEFDNKTQEQMFYEKKQLINEKYKNPVKVNWRTVVFDQSNLEVTLKNTTNSLGGRGMHNSGAINKTPIMRNYYKEEPFILSVSDLIQGHTEGFIFRFESVTTSIQVTTNTHTQTLYGPDTFYDGRNMSSPSQKTTNMMFDGDLELNTNTLSKNSALSNGIPKIDKDFVPSNKTDFRLDSKQLSFLLNPDNVDRLKDTIKKEAEIKFKKLIGTANGGGNVANRENGRETRDTRGNTLNGGNALNGGNGGNYTTNRSAGSDEDADLSSPDSRKNITEGNTSKFQDESGISNSKIDESSYISESSMSQSESSYTGSKDQSQRTENKLVTREAHKKGNGDYYHVDMSKITFLVYDFKKEKIIIIPDDVRQSQVEFKKSEDFKKEEKTEEHKKEMQKKKESVEEDEDLVLIEDNNSTNNETILYKQLEYSLAKVDVQPEVVRLKWVSFISFILILTITSIFFGFFLVNQNVFTDMLSLIVSSNKLISNTIEGIFYTRELVLLNNQKFTNYLHKDKATSIKNMTESILNLFSDSYTIDSSITSTSVFLTGNSMQKIQQINQKVTVSVLEDEYTTKQINLSLNSAFTEANTALYHIGNANIDTITPLDKNVYFFLQNGLNSLMITLMDNADIYVDVVYEKTVDFRNQFIYILMVMAVTCICVFIFIKISHSLVVWRKASYLEVFFEIGSDVIRRAIEKCEKFTQKMTSDDLNDGQSTRFESELEEESAAKSKKTEIVNKMENSHSSSKKGKKSNSESKVITFKIIIGLLIVFSYFLTLTLIYSSYVSTYAGYCNFYNITANEQSYYLSTFNTLREYFFENNSMVDNEPVWQKMSDIITDNYDYKLKREEMLETYIDTLSSSFISYYDTIQNSNICNITGDLFTNKNGVTTLSCQDFISNSTSYGLNILVTNYIEEIRDAKFKFDLLVENINPSFEYNNTLYYSYNSSVSAEYIAEDPFQIFNQELIKNLGILSLYIIKPAYDDLLSNLDNSIVAYLNSYQTVYIILFSLFSALIIVVYLFVWKPFENDLNKTIFKTKNMLAIIPKEVLASLPNIHKILGLGNNMAKIAKKKSNIY